MNLTYLAIGLASLALTILGAALLLRRRFKTPEPPDPDDIENVC